MIYLLLCVLFSSSLFVIFKLFTRYKIQTSYAIIANYFTASFVGFLFFEREINISELPQKPWFYGTLALGALFIVVFNITAKTSQDLGVSVASVASKMSLVIPVLVGLILYKEVASPFKIIGIILALAAVYFASIKDRTITVKVETLVLPILLFIGSGFVDTGIKFLQTKQMQVIDFPLFSMTVFGAAGTVGLLFIALKSIKKPLKLNFRNVIGGMILGSFNYFTIHFLLKALKHEGLNSLTVFTISNVATVLLSTLLGIFIFKEHISRKNWLGIGLAVISIVMVVLF
jgi:drug/metabolite transporter (DMT)-like permease